MTSTGWLTTLGTGLKRPFKASKKHLMTITNLVRCLGMTQKQLSNAFECTFESSILDVRII